METNALSEYSPIPPKLQRLGSDSSAISNNISDSRKLPSSKYKGVVPQPNGRWGSQIYEKHHRVWLGTFESESEAALSYDIAVYRFRGRDAITNFTLTKDESELDFISSHSKAEIVDMLRKHTYRDELNQRKRVALACTGQSKRKRNGNDGDKEQMFEKIVTPSDVGKLNRLVVPKLYAEKHFPMVNGASMLLSFEDEGGKVWRFRYSYWNSSQSYVLTKGWSRFVKEKQLKAGWVVVFGRLLGAEKQFYIECRCGAADDRNQSHTEVEPTAVAVRSDVFRLFGVNYLLDISRKEIDHHLFPLDRFDKKQCVRAL